jgi:putative tryptophan/tyrosine transport system substrate-binding protein
LARVAVLIDSTNPAMVAGWNAMRVAGQSAGVQTTPIEVRFAEDLDAAFETTDVSLAYAVVSPGLASTVLERLPKLALQHRVATLTNSDARVSAGELLSYGQSGEATYRIGIVVDKILRGAKPAELPVEQPTVLSLTVKVNTLRVLGLTIPPSVLPLVTEWIE